MSVQLSSEVGKNIRGYILSSYQLLWQVIIPQGDQDLATSRGRLFCYETTTKHECQGDGYFLQVTFHRSQVQDTVHSIANLAKQFAPRS